MTSRHVLHTVSEAFGLDPHLAFFEIARSHSSVIYKATGNNVGYIMHISESMDEELLANEAAIHEQLSDSPIIHGRLLTRPNGQWSFKAGKKYAYINLFIPGQHAAEGRVSIERNYLLGHALAIFHKKVKSLPYPDKLSFVQKGIEQHVRGELNLLCPHAPELYDKAMDFSSDRLPTGIIHGDFHVKNALFAHNKIAMIDFERAGEGILIADVARSAIDLCRTDSKFSKRKLVSFLDGYNSVRPISQQESRMLIPALAYNALIVANWFLTQKQTQQYNNFIRIGNSSLEC